MISRVRVEFFEAPCSEEFPELLDIFGNAQKTLCRKTLLVGAC
jgi:hypothetical protein